MICAAVRRSGYSLAMLALLSPVWLPGVGAAATPLDQAVPALTMVPADVSACSVWLRNREQFDAVASSKAWAAFQSIPAVQLGLAMAGAQLQGPDSPLQKFLADPANQQLIELVKGMVSDEVFVYGGVGSEKMLDVLTEIYAANQVTKLSAINEPRAERAMQQVISMIETLIERRDDIAIPQIVFGFRTANQEAALAQLARLEQLAGKLPQLNPQFKGRVSRAKLGNGDYLTLQLDGGQIPWEAMRRDEIPVDADELDKLIEHLKGLKLAISVGLAGKYVIVSIAESTEHLTTLGAGKSLASTTEMARLAPHAARRLTSVHFASKSLMSYVEFGQRDVGQLKDSARALIEALGLDDDVQTRVLTDVEDYVKDMEPYVGEHGALVECQFITERGLESFAYNWAQYPMSDGSKPLTLLEHVGGSPLLAVVTRMKQSPEQYQTTTKWAKKAYAYLTEFAIEYLDEEKQTQVRTALDRLQPLFGRLDDAMSKKFIPAMADGQAAFVLDAKSTSQQWFEQLPPTPRALPMLEMAIVYGVADSPLLEQAMSEFRAIINEAIPIFAELGEGQIDAEASLPAPEVRAVDGGKVFFYKLPKYLGIDKQVAPNAGLGKSVAVLSLIPKQTMRLLTKTPLATSGPAASAQRPLGSAVHVDIAGLIDAATPWIDFAIIAAHATHDDSSRSHDFVVDQPRDDEDGLADVEPEVQQILDQVHVGLKALKTFSSYSSVTYAEQDVWVTHGELRIVDGK